MSLALNTHRPVAGILTPRKLPLAAAAVTARAQTPSSTAASPLDSTESACSGSGGGGGVPAVALTWAAITAATAGSSAARTLGHRAAVPGEAIARRLTV